MSSTRFDIVLIIAMIVAIAFMIIKQNSNLSFNHRITSAYSMFTNKQMNKCLMYNQGKKEWVLVADQRYFDDKSKKTNILFYTISFSEEEIKELNKKNDDFISNTVDMIMNGAYTNEWRMSPKIIIKYDEGADQ